MSSIRGGLVSADGKNSTTTALGAGATFNSSAANYENVAGFSSITVNVTSDVDSAANGVIIYQSSDGVNEDNSSTFTYTGGGGADVYSIPVYAQYAKVEYVNGGSLQTQFRLQTIYHDNRQALRYGSQPKAQSLSVALASDQTFATSSLSYIEKIQLDSNFSIREYSYDTTGSGYTNMFSKHIGNERWYIWNMVAGCNNSNIGLLILQVIKDGTTIMRNSDYNVCTRHLNFKTAPMILDPGSYNFLLWTSDSKVKCLWFNYVVETI